MVTNVGEALGFVKREGPILPAQLANELNVNILFASAILSELVSKKEDVMLTYLKRGGSPYYYCKGQEEKLQALSENLSGKLKEVYELIKEKKVLRDKELSPADRVALRDLKDYAIQLNVGLNTGYEIFWKWYLLNNEEVKELIKKNLTGKKKEDFPREESNQKELIKEEPEEEQREKTQNESLVKTNENAADELDKFFEENKIYIISKESVRKNKESNFIADIPSNIGKLRYFVKYKCKKIISDSDLSSALDESNKKGLPILFLGDGELNKKAEKYLNDNVSGSIVFKKL